MYGAVFVFLVHVFLQTVPPHLSQRTANDTGRFSAFSIDAANVMRSCANTAAVSHGHSALLACMDRGAAPRFSEPPACCAKRVSCFSAREAFASFTGSAVTPDVGETLREDGEESRRISVYETSAVTAQKRAYASNCCSVLLSMCSQSDGDRVDRRRGDEATVFIADMAALTWTDTTVMVSLCPRIVSRLYHQATQTQTADIVLFFVVGSRYQQYVSLTTVSALFYFLSRK